MALWPFRRHSGRKYSRTGPPGLAVNIAAHPASRSVEDHVTLDSQPPKRNDRAVNPARMPSQRNPGRESNKLQRRRHSHSFPLDQHRSVDHSAVTDRIHPNQPAPQPQSSHQDQTRPRDLHRDHHVGLLHLPTLHSSHPSRHQSRRNSGQRRREEENRETEINNMARQMPTNVVASASASAIHPGRKDSKRIRAGLGLAKNWEAPASNVSLPTLDSIHSSMSSDSEYGSFKVSLLDSLSPRPTLRYALYPRLHDLSTSDPIRDQHPHQSHRHSPDRSLSPSPPRPSKLTEPIPETTLRAHKRVHDLADGLDAGDLRELMERDKRRKERKRQLVQERTERHLARSAAIQREEVDRARQSGTPPPRNYARGVIGRELAGLGAQEAPSAVVTSSRRKRPDILPEANRLPIAAGSVDSVDVGTVSNPQPGGQFHDMSSESIRSSFHDRADEEVQEPPFSPQPPAVDERSSTSLRRSPLIWGFLKSSRSRSKSSLASDNVRSTRSPPAIASSPTALHQDIESKHGQVNARRFSFLALFHRWTGRTRITAGSSSDSSTSFDDIPVAPRVEQSSQAHVENESQFQSPSRALETEMLVVSNIAASSQLDAKGIPKRTRSRFREDLPDFSQSTRLRVGTIDMASPPSVPLLPSQHLDDKGTTVKEPDEAIPQRLGTPTSAHRSVDEKTGHTPTSASWRSYPAAQSPQPHSLSLASIDSEGSWLSGRIRASSGAEDLSRLHAHDQTRSDHSDHSAPTSRHEDENLTLADHEYLSRLAPPSDIDSRNRSAGVTSGDIYPNQAYRVHEHFPNLCDSTCRESVGEPRPSSDEGDGEGDRSNIGELISPRWGAVIARHKPRVVYSGQAVLRPVKSREGLVNGLVDGDSIADVDGDEEDDTGIDEEGGHGLQRATSVNLGRAHARHISAGSAKLLDIAPSIASKELLEMGPATTAAARRSSTLSS